VIYADYNGSAPPLPAVREYLRKRLDSDLFANPNAIHSMGQRLTKGIEKSRSIIAEVVGCYPDQIFFNSGASEGISHIISSVLNKSASSKKIVITSPIEHIAVSAALNHFKMNHNFTIKYVELDLNGVVRPQSLEKLLRENSTSVSLVAIMAANNETGALQPYVEIASICTKFGVDYFSDTTQLIGKGEFDFLKSGMDFAVCSGHKIGALTGSGFIIAKEPTKLHSHIFGSTQEHGKRGGTQHYLGIETLAVALSDFNDKKTGLKTLQEARLDFESQMKSAFSEVIIIAEKAPRLAGTTLIGYPGLHGQAVQIELESHDIFVTTSAACSDNQPETSEVLKSMEIHEDLGRSVIRISLSYSHGKAEYSLLVQALKDAYNKLSKIHSY